MKLKRFILLLAVVFLAYMTGFSYGQSSVYKKASNDAKLNSMRYSQGGK